VAVQKSLFEVFGSTGLDPDPEQRAKILKRAKRVSRSKKRRKRRRKRRRKEAQVGVKVALHRLPALQVQRLKEEQVCSMRKTSCRGYGKDIRVL
jgi:hypothetical protein